MRSKSSKIASNGSPCSGARAGNRAADVAGRDPREDRVASAVIEVFRDPLDKRWPCCRNSSGSSDGDVIAPYGQRAAEAGPHSTQI